MFLFRTVIQRALLRKEGSGMFLFRTVIQRALLQWLTSSTAPTLRSPLPTSRWPGSQLPAGLHRGGSAAINPAVPPVFRRAIRHLMLAILSVLAFGGTALKAATPTQVEGSWEKVACPFDSRKALLPVTCGRLKVPENYDDPKGRAIEIAVMIISPPSKVDPE